MHAPTREEVAAAIAQRRYDLGGVIRGKHRAMSASKFGRLIGIEGASVYAIESGKVAPSYDTLVALVQKAGMDPATLLGEQGAVDLVAAGVAS